MPVNKYNFIHPLSCYCYFPDEFLVGFFTCVTIYCTVLFKNIQTSYLNVFLMALSLLSYVSENKLEKFIHTVYIYSIYYVK